ncbi:MAG: sensor histidine kinase [Lachnospira sp.]
MDEKKNKITSGINIAVIIAAAILFVIIGVFSRVSAYNERENTNGFVVKESSCIEKDNDSTPIGVIKEYSIDMDTITRDETLAFYTVHQYVKVFIDGECIYQLQPSGQWNMCKTVGSNWNMIPLNREDSGKTITVQITPVYESFRNREVEFLVGDNLDIYIDRLKKDLFQIILSCLAIFIGLVFVGVAFYRYISSRREKNLIYFGIFAVMIGIWRLTDTRFTPFIFPDYAVLIYNLSLVMLMFGTIPFVKWIEHYYDVKMRKIFQCYCSLSVLIGLIQMTLQFAAIRDLRETLLVTHVMIGTCVIMLFVTYFIDRKKNHHKKKEEKRNNFAIILAFGIILDVVAFYIKGNSSGLVFSLLAFVIYIILKGMSMMFNYNKKELELAEKDRQIAEKERTLMEKRILVMASQIKSHFIFNVLTAISGFCKTDPQKADKVLIRFSRYLRKNIKILETDGFIDFVEELEQVEDYVALEQVRFGDAIEFEEDIQETRFKIPPLTIQPLVENAIKHGLVEHNRSGVISLTTRKNGDNIEIIVADNGAGFEIDNYNSTDSVGIKNVKFRLKNMVDGELQISSIVGEGTEVIIRLPFEKEYESEAEL